MTTTEVPSSVPVNTTQKQFTEISSSWPHSSLLSLVLGGAETGLPRPSHHFLPKSGSHDQHVLPPSSSNHICHSCCVSKCWPEGRVDLIREDALAIYCPGLLPAPPLHEDGRGRVNAQLMCHPIHPAAQRSSYSFLMCSVQGPELFGADSDFRKNSGSKCSQATALLVLVCRLCFAGFMFEWGRTVNPTCDKWQGIPKLPVWIYALSHKTSQNAVCLHGNLLLRST